VIKEELFREEEFISTVFRRVWIDFVCADYSDANATAWGYVAEPIRLLLLMLDCVASPARVTNRVISTVAEITKSLRRDQGVRLSIFLS